MNQNNVYIKVAGTPSAPVIPVNGWVRPTDWLEIDTVADNCINLLVSDSGSVAFNVEVYGSEAAGTYLVDFGDGSAEEEKTSNTNVYHTYTTGGTLCSQGYKIFKIRIYGASGNILKFSSIQQQNNTSIQSTPILAAAFGTRYITNYYPAFNNGDVRSLMLKEVKFAGFESPTTIIKTIFSNCINVSKITLPSSWGSVVDVSGMFSYLKALDTVNLPASWGNVTKTSSLFNGCSALKSVQLPALWGNVTETADMFAYCSALVKVNLPASWDNVTTTMGMFKGCSSLATLILPNSWGFVTNPSIMFTSCASLMTINLPALWGSVTDTSSMFYGCLSLNYIDLPDSWANITTAFAMFYNCQGLISIDCGTSWGSMTNVYKMFCECRSLCSVKLPTTWSITMTSINEMFSQCQSLTAIVLPISWSNITSISYLFNTCVSLISVILPASWGNITNTSYMFAGCLALSRLTLPINFGNINTATGMFATCSNLMEIYNFDKIGSLTEQADLTTILHSASVSILQNISLNSLLKSLSINGSAGSVLKISSIRLTNLSSTFTGQSPQINVSYTSLNRPALLALFNDLPTLTSKSIRITGCAGTADLTVDDKLIATKKGWTVLT